MLATIGCARAQTVDPLRIPDTQLEPMQWNDVAGWTGDDHAAAFQTFLISCRPFVASSRRSSSRDTRPVAEGLRDVCKRAVAAGGLGRDAARMFFEENFRPLRIARLGESQGLLTGYFEPVVDGSRFPSPEFHTPLYRRPPDLVVAGQTRRSQVFPNRGNVGRRNAKGTIEPYYDRAAIEEGALDGQHLEICWLRDPFDVFSIQIQGSARVKLEDGTTLRVNYAAHNGHPYTAVGRALIDRNIIPREEMSMNRIRQWVQANPVEGRTVLHTNKAFVFFRITGLSDEGEAVGAQGVPLTPGRSIAVDRTHVYGTPFFIEADLPVDSDRPTHKFRRLMIAQDTGSAILGPARADLYWGAGDDAGRIAGRIRHQGRFVMLLPRDLDIVEAGKQMPLPRARPTAAEAEAAAAKQKSDEDEMDPGAKPIDHAADEVPMPVPRPRSEAELIELQGKPMTKQ